MSNEQQHLVDPADPSFGKRSRRPYLHPADLPKLRGTNRQGSSQDPPTQTRSKTSMSLAGVYLKSSAPTGKCSRTRDLGVVGCLTYLLFTSQVFQAERFRQLLLRQSSFGPHDGSAWRSLLPLR